MRSRTIPRTPHKRSQPPVVSAHEIVRLRLLDRLTAPSGNPLSARITLVRGPAGFGKTTLLAQAYRQVIARGESAVWLDCSELNADSQNFIDALYSAADLTGIDKSEVEFTTTDLAARLECIDPGIYVFLDEFEQLVGTSVEGALERLTEALPGTDARRPLVAPGAAVVVPEARIERSGRDDRAARPALHGRRAAEAA